MNHFRETLDTTISNFENPVEDVLDVLIRARKSITNPINWDQGRYATNIEGEPLTFCAIGALQNAGTGNPFIENILVWEAEQVLLAMLPDNVSLSVELFNDGRGRQHADVIDLYDKAIDYLGRMGEV